MVSELPFEIPAACGRFYETLEAKVQKELFRNYYSRFESDIREGSGHSIENYLFEIEMLENVLEDGDHLEIASYLQGDETSRSIEKINPFTGEKIYVNELDSNRLSEEDARAKLNDEIMRRRDFLNSSPEVLLEKFWREDIENFDESYLFDAVTGMPEFSKVISEFELHKLTQEVIRRANRTNLHKDYAAEAIKCREQYMEAEKLNQAGDPSFLDALQSLSMEAIEFKSQGRRITSEGGPCYVCGRFVWPHNGELLIWSEIPNDVRKRYIPDVFQKWHIRHFWAECSGPEFGERDIFLHPTGNFEKRNAKPEKCIVCAADVPAQSGWLIPVSLVPKWKQTRPAFPGAKTKNFYVMCGKVD